MDGKGLIAKLFDFSFSEFIAIDVVKFLYILGLVGAGLAALAVGFGGFANGFLSGLLTLVIGAPLVFALLTLVARLNAELVLVLFRIAENTQRMAEQSEAPGAGKASGF